VGHACLYWTYSSVTATEQVLMNDLFVVAGSRGGGVGRALIEHSRGVARQRGAAKLTWMTALDNHTAQALYDSFGGERSTWFEYELDP
jgi:GNAT superfamily N-acetyltransferase